MNIRDEIDVFEVFKLRFISRWDAAESSGHFHLTDPLDYFYAIEEEGKKISVYEGTKSTVKGVFTPERAWMDDSYLEAELTSMLKEFLPFLRNERSLLRENDWTHVIH